MYRIQQGEEEGEKVPGTYCWVHLPEEQQHTSSAGSTAGRHLEAQEDAACMNVQGERRHQAEVETTPV